MEGGGQTSVPAGWYPDPNGSGLRYWDGNAWTTHTAPAQQTAASRQPGDEQGQRAPGAERAAVEQAEVAAQREAAGAEQQAAARPPGAVEQSDEGRSEPTAAAVGGSQAPADPHAPHTTTADERPGRLEWTLSVLLPILPLAGLIWGIYLKRQGPAMENPANVAIVFSLAVILVLVLVLR